MKSFGEYIRSQRVRRNLLLREVAASLKIDPSLLSRIESNLKRPTRDQVIRLAGILKASESEMLIQYLSDRVVYELRDEGLSIQAMRVAEMKIRHLKKKAKER